MGKTKAQRGIFSVRLEWALAGVLFFICWLALCHVDLSETANHAWLLLDGTFQGRFLHFYEDVYAHTNSLYYLNAAHYNIVMYIIFAVWELPLYLITQIFRGGTVYEPALWLWAKCLPIAFAGGCAYFVARLAGKLGCTAETARRAAMLFLLFPITLFTTFCMGQYDAICLLFILWALNYYADGKLWQFTFFMGAAAACKFFAVLVFLPLLLLAEKRLLHLLKYCLCSLWLLVPTTLLFQGNTGDMSLFNSLMAERLFVPDFDTGVGAVPIFMALYALGLVACLLYTPKEKDRLPLVIWVCLAVFGVLFSLILWHPQWLVLIVPFIVLGTITSQNQRLWLLLDLLLSAGFFAACFIEFPLQVEANMADLALPGILGFATSAIPDWNGVAFYLGLLPYLAVLEPALFCIPLWAGVIFRAPLCGGTVAAKLESNPHTVSLRSYTWWLTGIGFGFCYAVPVVFTWIKCMLRA